MHYFKDLTVQLRVKDFFTHSIESGHLAHAFIFYGGQGRGKEAFAIELAKTLNCTSTGIKPCNSCPACLKTNNLSHPDVKFIYPLSRQTSPDQQVQILKDKAKNPYSPIEINGHKSISIEAIRALKNEAKYASFESGKRIFIIYGAEYFSREAANSFLKLLEEPPENLYIILITDEIRSLLDTIRSRCQPVYFPEFNDSEIESILRKYDADMQDTRALIRISQHNIKRIYQLLHSENNLLRETVYDFIKAVAGNNYFTISTIIDRIVQKRDKNLVSEFLNLILLWFRDSIRFLILEDSSDFANLDYEEKIKKFADFYRHIEMEKIVELVEQASVHIQMNAHPALTLTNLSIEMKQILKKAPLIREAV